MLDTEQVFSYDRAMLSRQLSLLGAPAAPEIGFDEDFVRVRRLTLERGAWVDHAPGWLRGADTLFAALEGVVSWRSERRVMYEKVVDVPRLLARAHESPHPALEAASRALSRRYDRALDQLTLALYRGGSDSVAWHGDRMGPLKADTVVAIVSLGEPRRFMLRPALGEPGRSAGRPAMPETGPRRSMSFELRGGDLLVMGGSCQLTYEHCVPKVASAGPRIAVMFREAVPEVEGPP